MSVVHESIVLPPVFILQHRLHFLVDLETLAQPEKVYATLRTWVILQQLPPAQQARLERRGILNEGQWYDYASAQYENILSRMEHDQLTQDISRWLEQHRALILEMGSIGQLLVEALSPKLTTAPNA